MTAHPSSQMEDQAPTGHNYTFAGTQRTTPIHLGGTACPCQPRTLTYLHPEFFSLGGLNEKVAGYKAIVGNLLLQRLTPIRRMGLFCT